jgi:hypothetical protein
MVANMVGKLVALWDSYSVENSGMQKVFLLDKMMVKLKVVKRVLSMVLPTVVELAEMTVSNPVGMKELK